MNNTAATTQSPRTVFQAAQHGRQTGQQVLQEMEFWFKLIKNVVWVLCWFYAVPAELLLRRHFGERYLRPIVLVSAAVIVFGPIVAMPLSPMAWIWPALSVGLIGFHLWEMRRRKKHGIRWHSYCSGAPYLHRVVKQRLSLAKTYLIAEPVACGLIGGVLIPVLPGLGGYLVTATVPLFVKALIDLRRARSKVLDNVDGQIESQHMGQALQGGEGPEDLEGWCVLG